MSRSWRADDYSWRMAELLNARQQECECACMGTEGMVTVVIAETGDAHLLGATALETLGFGVDPIRQQLIPQSLLAM